MFSALDVEFANNWVFSGFLFFMSVSDSSMFEPTPDCFLLRRALLFWNQLYTFVSEICPYCASSVVISWIFCLLGVPVHSLYTRSRICSCTGVGVHRCLAVIFWPLDATSGSKYGLPILIPKQVVTQESPCKHNQ